MNARVRVEMIASDERHTPNPLSPTVVKAGRLTLRGYSRSGIATWIEVPELDALFDVGQCALTSLGLDHVFLTHAHGDHSGGLLRHAALRAMMSQPTARYYVPAHLLPHFEALIATFAAMEEVPLAEYARPHLVPLEAGQRVEFKKGLAVQAFEVEHRIRSLGYTVLERRRKLKAEFASRPGEELGRLRRDGVAIEDEHDEPLLTFIGDCTGRTILEQAHLWQSPVLVLEVTFLRPEEREHSAKYGHTHLAELAAALERHGDTSRVQHLVLKHFSLKYGPDEIRSAVRTQIPERFQSRIHLLID